MNHVVLLIRTLLTQTLDISTNEEYVGKGDRTQAQSGAGQRDWWTIAQRGQGMLTTKISPLLFPFFSYSSLMFRDEKLLDKY